MLERATGLHWIRLIFRLRFGMVWFDSVRLERERERGIYTYIDMALLRRYDGWMN